MAMTSKTSSTSDQLTANLHRMRFPPRSELPPYVTIESLPLVGTSWYERGFIYWVRRLGIGVIFAMVAFAYPAMILGALDAISPPGTGLHNGLLTGEIVFTIVSAVLLLRRMWRNMLNGKGATRRGTATAGRTGGAIGSLAFTSGGMIAGLLVFCSLLTAGLVLASFVVWLVPVPPMERYARRTLAEELRVNNMVKQLRPRSKHYGSKNHRNAH